MIFKQQATCDVSTTYLCARYVQSNFNTIPNILPFGLINFLFSNWNILYKFVLSKELVAENDQKSFHNNDDEVR